MGSILHHLIDCPCIACLTATSVGVVGSALTYETLVQTWERLIQNKVSSVGTIRIPIIPQLTARSVVPTVSSVANATVLTISQDYFVQEYPKEHPEVTRAFLAMISE